MSLEFRMNIHLTYINMKRGCAAILHPTGTLDWSTYADLIAQAWAARMAGAHALIVDLYDVERIGTAGLVGLYAVARLTQGSPPPDIEAGWAALRALVEDQPLVAPLAVANPRAIVRHALANAPFSDFLALHADLDAALAAVAA
jgi:ABC-type transporter Mla MlaB component